MNLGIIHFAKCKALPCRCWILFHYQKYSWVISSICCYSKLFGYFPLFWLPMWRPVEQHVVLSTSHDISLFRSFSGINISPRSQLHGQSYPRSVEVVLFVLLIINMWCFCDIIIETIHLSNIIMRCDTDWPAKCGWNCRRQLEIQAQFYCRFFVSLLDPALRCFSAGIPFFLSVYQPTFYLILFDLV